MSSKVEIEVKLTGGAKALAKAWRAAPLQGDPASEEITRSLENVYFDTTDLRLRRLGYAFRIRKDGSRLVQTLKSNDEGGRAIARRREWSAAVPSLDPDISQIGDEATRAKIGHLLPGELLPIFTTKVQRRQRLVKLSGVDGQISVVEVAFDQGEIVANGVSEPIGEIEFELQRGMPAAIYSLISEVLSSAALRIETRSKSARGYALAAGKAPAWQRAEKISLSAGEPPAIALRKTLGNCMRHWLANEAAARDGSDPEGVHQMRIGLRRLRSALVVFAGTISAEDAAWLSGEARWLLRRIGPARDWDVFLGELLPPVPAMPTGGADQAALVEAGKEMRRASYRQVRETIASSRYTALVTGLGAWLETQRSGDGGSAAVAGRAPEPMALLAFAGTTLRKRHKRALKLGRGFKKLTPEARHDLRIALKKLRYSVEFFRSLYGSKRVRPYLRTLKELQDSLGHLNDVSESQRLLMQLLAGKRRAEAARGLALAAGTVIGWYAHLNQANERRIRRSWKAFAAGKPFWDDS